MLLILMAFSILAGWKNSDFNERAVLVIVMINIVISSLSVFIARGGAGLIAGFLINTVAMIFGYWVGCKLRSNSGHKDETEF